MNTLTTHLDQIGSLASRIDECIYALVEHPSERRTTNPEFNAIEQQDFQTLWNLTANLVSQSDAHRRSVEDVVTFDTSRKPELLEECLTQLQAHQNIVKEYSQTERALDVLMATNELYKCIEQLELSTSEGKLMKALHAINFIREANHKLRIPLTLSPATPYLLRSAHAVHQALAERIQDALLSTMLVSEDEGSATFANFALVRNLVDSTANNPIEVHISQMALCHAMDDVLRDSLLSFLDSSSKTKRRSLVEDQTAFDDIPSLDAVLARVATSVLEKIIFPALDVGLTVQEGSPEATQASVKLWNATHTPENTFTVHVLAERGPGTFDPFSELETLLLDIMKASPAIDAGKRALNKGEVPLANKVDSFAIRFWTRAVVDRLVKEIIDKVLIGQLPATANDEKAVKEFISISESAIKFEENVLSLFYNALGLEDFHPLSAWASNWPVHWASIIQQKALDEVRNAVTSGVSDGWESVMVEIQTGGLDEEPWELTEDADHSSLRLRGGGGEGDILRLRGGASRFTPPHTQQRSNPALSSSSAPPHKVSAVPSWLDVGDEEAPVEDAWGLDEDAGAADGENPEDAWGLDEAAEDAWGLDEASEEGADGQLDEAEALQEPLEEVAGEFHQEVAPFMQKRASTETTLEPENSQTSSVDTLKKDPPFLPEMSDTAEDAWGLDEDEPSEPGEIGDLAGAETGETSRGAETGEIGGLAGLEPKQAPEQRKGEEEPAPEVGSTVKSNTNITDETQKHHDSYLDDKGLGWPVSPNRDATILHDAFEASAPTAHVSKLSSGAIAREGHLPPPGVAVSEETGWDDELLLDEGSEISDEGEKNAVPLQESAVAESGTDDIALPVAQGNALPTTFQESAPPESFNFLPKTDVNSDMEPSGFSESQKHTSGDTNDLSDLSIPTTPALASSPTTAEAHDEPTEATIPIKSSEPEIISEVTETADMGSVRQEEAAESAEEQRAGAQTLEAEGNVEVEGQVAEIGEDAPSSSPEGVSVSHLSSFEAAQLSGTTESYDTSVNAGISDISLQDSLSLTRGVGHFAEEQETLPVAEEQPPLPLAEEQPPLPLAEEQPPLPLAEEQPPLPVSEEQEQDGWGIDDDMDDSDRGFGVSEEKDDATKSDAAHGEIQLTDGLDGISYDEPARDSTTQGITPEADSLAAESAAVHDSGLTDLIDSTDAMSLGPSHGTPAASAIEARDGQDAFQRTQPLEPVPIAAASPEPQGEDGWGLEENSEKEDASQQEGSGWGLEEAIAVAGVSAIPVVGAVVGASHIATASGLSSAEDKDVDESPIEDRSVDVIDTEPEAAEHVTSPAQEMTTTAQFTAEAPVSKDASVEATSVLESTGEDGWGLGEEEEASQDDTSVHGEVLDKAEKAETEESDPIISAVQDLSASTAASTGAVVDRKLPLRQASEESYAWFDTIQDASTPVNTGVPISASAAQGVATQGVDKSLSSTGQGVVSKLPKQRNKALEETDDWFSEVTNSIPQPQAASKRRERSVKKAAEESVKDKAAGLISKSTIIEKSVIQDTKPPPPAVEHMAISQRSLDIVRISEKVLKEAMHIICSDSGNGVKETLRPTAEHLLNTFISILAYYRAISAVAHNKTLASVPSLGMQYTNDAFWLADEVERLWQTYYGASKTSGTVWTDLLNTMQENVTNTAAKFRTLGTRERKRQIALQQQALLDTLDEAEGFADTDDDARYEQCQSVLDQIVLTLQRLVKLWKPVMNPSALYPIVGGLIDSVLQQMTDEIIAIRDISEVESRRLNELCQSIHKPIEALFEASPVPVGQEVASWFKFVFLSELLDSSMADILFLYDNGHLVDFTPQQIAGLIRALFSESPLRQKNIEHVLNGI